MHVSTLIHDILLPFPFAFRAENACRCQQFRNEQISARFVTLCPWSLVVRSSEKDV